MNDGVGFEIKKMKIMRINDKIREFSSCQDTMEEKVIDSLRQNACFSLYNGEICGFLSTFVAKILNWGLCFPNVDAKRRYDTE